ncbi:translation initiation factor 4E, partial [Dipodascopsis tothii]|uniref:translation initiation factor 4E n=1 Tax=Dipodascopsis tothii TaxID=44089 RepID=UPI0034CF30FE
PFVIDAESHTLQYDWTLWFLHRPPGTRITDYEQATKAVKTFSTAQEFWELYSYLVRPSELPYTSEYHVFKRGVRPIWEDPTNINGGKWIFRLKKAYSSQAWEAILIALVGGGEGDFGGEPLGDEVVGAVISVRRGNDDIISVWNKSGSNGSVNLKIRDAIRRVIGLPQFVAVEYKIHSESMRE